MLNMPKCACVVCCVWVKWRRAVLVAGSDPNNFCKYITTAVTQSFSVNKNMTLAATISVEDYYTSDDLRLSLDKIRLNGRSPLLCFRQLYLPLTSIGVARILSGVHFSSPKKFTSFLSRRSQNTR